MEWLSVEALDYSKAVEGLLHTIIPLASAVSISYFTATGMGLGLDLGNLFVAPYIYAIVLYHGIYLVGKLPSSYIPLQQDLRRKDHHRHRPRNNVQDEESRDDKKRDDDRIVDMQHVYSISRQCYYMLTLCLQITPTILYLWQRKSGTLSEGFTLMQDLGSASTLLSISYLLSWQLQHHQISLWSLHQSPTTTTTTTTNVLPLFAAIVGFVSFQYRYLVPISLAISQHFHGTQIQPLWQICLSFNVGILGMAGTAWVYSKKNKEDEPIMGKAHDDICAILTMLSIFSVGTSFPLPYGVILLLVVSTMSIAMFTITKRVSLNLA